MIVVVVMTVAVVVSVMLMVVNMARSVLMDVETRFRRFTTYGRDIAGLHIEDRGAVAGASTICAHQIASSSSMHLIFSSPPLSR